MDLILIIYCVILVPFNLVLTTRFDTTCDLGESAPPRKLYYCGKEVDLTIQQSDRLQHRLLNAILAIIFIKKLGYVNVDMVEEPNSSNALDKLEKIVESFYNGSRVCQLLGDAMVNIEVNRNMEYDLSSGMRQYFGRSEDLGYTGTSSQYKWFLHLPLHSNNSSLQQVYPSYVEFYSRDISALFPNETFLDESHPFLHNQKNYRPDHCREKKCAIVFSTFESETGFLKKHIESLQLNLHIVWLERTIGDLYKFAQESKHIFFIVDNVDWPFSVKLKTPNYLCFDVWNSSRVCPYEKVPNTKLVWHYVISKIYMTVENFKIDSAQVSNLIRDHRINTINNKNSTIETSACSWLQNNGQFVANFQQISDIKRPFIIHLLYCNTFYNNNTNERLSKLVKYTTDFINNEVSSNLFTIRVQINLIDCTTSTSALSLKIFFDKNLDINRQRIVGYVMPAIPNALDMVAELSKVYQIPVITFSVNGPSFESRYVYPNVFRIVAEKKQFLKAYLEFLQENKWSRVATISGIKQNNLEFPNELHKYLSEHGLTFMWEQISERESDSIYKSLRKLKDNQARIIIVDMEANIHQNMNLLCHAYKLGMTPRNNYVWILPDWPYLYDSVVLRSEVCKASELEQIIDGHFTFIIPSLKNEDSHGTDQENVNVFRNQLKDQFRDRRNVNYDGAGFIVDAIWTISLALRRLISEYRGAEDELRSANPDTSNIIKLSLNINNTHFDGVSGKIIFYHGSRKTSYIQVKQWFRKNWTVIQTVSINAETNKFQVLNNPNSEPKWLTENKRKPEDGRVDCTFRDTTKEFYIECSDYWIIWTIVGVILSIVALLSTITIHTITKRYQIRKMNFILEQIKTRNTHLINLLHTFEVSRRNVHIIWEIGRGSFGTVFGGRLDMDDGSWKAVSIKTLNHDASTESANDFLMEANTMAAFDHKNIVKLLGVCTLEKPIYIIMEFMLNRDLKKFLLSRRYLLDEPGSEESHYISNKGLTNMALNLAMALSYLASKNFIHRDIASRNCMVNAHGIVKLGDFGMTRNVFDKGEYVCQRKGLFPVRWMAPESLNYGQFTSFSDVWSYGVVLYEIITFGGTPYHNMEKHDVWEYVVKRGKMVLPNGINCQLRSLMLQCWNYEDTKRPAAADIVVFLADRPELLHPCLEEKKNFASSSFTLGDGTADTPVVRYCHTRGCSAESDTAKDSLGFQRKDSGYSEVKIHKRWDSNCDHSDSESVFLTCTY